MSDEKQTVENEMKAQKRESFALGAGLIVYPIILALVGFVCYAIFMN